MLKFSIASATSATRPLWDGQAPRLSARAQLVSCRRSSRSSRARRICSAFAGHPMAIRTPDPMSMIVENHDANRWKQWTINHLLAWLHKSVSSGVNPGEVIGIVTDFRVTVSPMQKGRLPQLVMLGLKYFCILAFDCLSPCQLRNFFGPKSLRDVKGLRSCYVNRGRCRVRSTFWATNGVRKWWITSNGFCNVGFAGVPCLETAPHLGIGDPWNSQQLVLIDHVHIPSVSSSSPTTSMSTRH